MSTDAEAKPAETPEPATPQESFDEAASIERVRMEWVSCLTTFLGTQTYQIGADGSESLHTTCDAMHEGVRSSRDRAVSAAFERIARECRSDMVDLSPGKDDACGR